MHSVTQCIRPPPPPAISYECIKTISSIYPNSGLISKAAKTIARFVAASNNNWKYLGITALASLVLINPQYAVDYQGVVIDCLDDPDETLKRKVSYLSPICLCCLCCWCLFGHCFLFVFLLILLVLRVCGLEWLPLLAYEPLPFLPLFVVLDFRLVVQDD